MGFAMAQPILRAAILYNDRQSATEALGEVKTKTRDDAYVVSMEKWCAGAQQKRADFIECGG